MLVTNNNKMNNHFSPQIAEHKKAREIWRWKSRSWLGTVQTCVGVKPVHRISTLCLLFLTNVDKINENYQIIADKPLMLWRPLHVGMKTAFHDQIAMKNFRSRNITSHDQIAMKTFRSRNIWLITHAFAF